MKTKINLQQISALVYLAIGMFFFSAYYWGFDDSPREALFGVLLFSTGGYVILQWDVVERSARASLEARELRARTDLLLQHAGLTYDPKADAPAGVLDALAKGDKVGAIKCYRQATAAGVMEARLYVEGLQIK